ncbi:hypothetical protein HOE425_331454 [Hoeflea sp. EC-HK425]|nr:hypothetical protein HOE425_331454 [Hoeflea sp. EC-HK425]
MRQFQTLLIFENGRSGGIRTHDPLSPRQVRYRAALRSDWGQGLDHQCFAGKSKMSALREKPGKAVAALNRRSPGTG